MTGPNDNAGGHMEQEEIEHDLRALESLSGDPLSLGQAAAVGRAIARLRADLDRCDDAKWQTVRVLVYEGAHLERRVIRLDDGDRTDLMPGDIAIISSRIPRRQVVEVDGDTEVVND